jgi:hypothetical protein
MPTNAQYSRNSPLVNWLPLSMMMQLGPPKWHTSPRMNLTAEMVRTGSTSTHLVNLSMMTGGAVLM